MRMPLSPSPATTTRLRLTAAATSPPSAAGARTATPGRPRPDTPVAVPGCASPSSGCWRRGTSPGSPTAPMISHHASAGAAATPNRASGEPEAELAEVVRMPRPTPQPAVHHLTRPAVPHEAVHLDVGDQFECDRRQPDDERHPRQPGQTRRRAGSRRRTPAPCRGRPGTVGIRWMATRSATNSKRPARCLNIG